jgi:hypothetical protein
MLSNERLDDQPFSYDQVIYFADDVKIYNVVNEAKQRLINTNKISVRKIPSVIVEERWEELIPSGTNGKKEYTS